MSLEHWHRYLLAAELVRDLDVLDIACGQGYGSHRLARTARSVVGVDISSEAVAHASAAYRAPNLRYLEGSVAAIPLPDQSVDLIVSFETIEHVSAELQRAFYVEVKRVLRPNGRLVISTPDKAVYTTARNYQNPYHEREYERAEFEDTLKAQFPFVELLDQRAGLFSVVTKGGVQETFGLQKTAEGDHVPGDKKLSYEYVVAICSHEPRSSGFTTSVAFDQSILSEQYDTATQALLAATAVAEERAQEIAQLRAELANLRGTAEERGQEIAKLCDELLSQRAMIEERAQEIERTSRELIDARAVAAERSEELHAKAEAHGAELEKLRHELAQSDDERLRMANTILELKTVGGFPSSRPPPVATPARTAVSLSPLVTVVIPSYNHRRFIFQAVQSVLEQTHREIELIIVDDGSSDDSVDALRDAYGNDPRVTLVSRENRGAHQTINEAIARGRGEFVAILNSDDVYEPTRLERMVEAARTHGGHPFFAISALRVVDEAGRPSQGSGPLSYYASVLDKFLGEPDPAAFWVGNLAMTTSNFFFSRQVFERVGGFSPLRYTHDWDWGLRAAERFKLVRLDEVLLHYRVHGSNTIAEGSNIWKHVAENAYVFASALQRAGLTRMAEVAGLTPVEVMRALLSNESFAPVPTLFLMALGLDEEAMISLLRSGALENILPAAIPGEIDLMLSTEHLRRKLKTAAAQGNGNVVVRPPEKPERSWSFKVRKAGARWRRRLTDTMKTK